MNINFVIFSFEWIVYLNAFIVTSLLPEQSDSNVTASECRRIFAFDISYWFLWIAVIIRTIITSLMNVRFSRDLSKTNR